MKESKDKAVPQRNEMAGSPNRNSDTGKNMGTGKDNRGAGNAHVPEGSGNIQGAQGVGQTEARPLAGKEGLERPQEHWQNETVASNLGKGEEK